VVGGRVGRPGGPCSTAGGLRPCRSPGRVAGGSAWWSVFHCRGIARPTLARCLLPRFLLAGEHGLAWPGKLGFMGLQAGQDASATGLYALAELLYVLLARFMNFANSGLHLSTSFWQAAANSLSCDFRQAAMRPPPGLIP